MKKIKIAVIGIGNCASSLIQGIYYYKDKNREDAIGLMHWDIGGYKPYDIEVVAAVDVDRRKVEKDVSEAIFSEPNCTKVFCKDIPRIGVSVVMGKVLDGVAQHMKESPDDQTFVISEEKEAARFYADCCLEANVAFINCIPVFIASDKEFAERFEQKNLPIIGDDIKAQIGATITHRTLAKLFEDRGVKLDRTYQLNTGGNTDFLNMLVRERLKSKKISKTEAVQ